MSMTVKVLVANRILAVPISGLTPIGGQQCQGIQLQELGNKAEVAVLAPQGEALAVHSLLERSKGPSVIGPGQVARVGELSLFLDSPSMHPPTQSDSLIVNHASKALLQVTSSTSAETALSNLLDSVLEYSGHEQGLVVSKNLSGKFEILNSRNLQANDAWLSEGLVHQCLEKGQPVLLQNVIGSVFGAQQSLIATGLLSVFCWPLKVQNTCVGAVMVGSRRPHSGLNDGLRRELDLLIQLCSVVTHFRLSELRLKNEIEDLRAHQQDTPFVSKNPKVAQVCDLARKTAPSDLSILIQGETGVGKEVLARWIHNASDRSRGPFVAVNCGAIPHELLESVLFGHRKGAFTGAHSDQTGKVQAAHKGTLFLDEIGDLPLALQAKLLRVLQERIVEPLGAQRGLEVDIRVLSATHKSVPELISTKAFREDLYYRIAEVTLLIPPLRSRPEDIRLIATQLLRETCPHAQFNEAAWQWLLAQPWPGNVRELKSAIKRASLLAGDDIIDADHFQDGGAQLLTDWAEDLGNKAWLGGSDLEHAKTRFSQLKIRQALAMTDGNRTKAAALLGITPRTLFRYLERDGEKELS